MVNMKNKNAQNKFKESVNSVGKTFFFNRNRDKKVKIDSKSKRQKKRMIFVWKIEIRIK